jgi:hypothetical protein
MTEITMSIVPEEDQEDELTRGPDLLLVHCAALDGGGRPSAFSRLEAAIGVELARRLVRALSDSQGRRGSSSP